MPADYRNSLGWLGLQLRAQRLQQQQQQDFQRETMAREQQQTDINNALAVGKHQMAVDADRENRKLALAGLMQRAAESRELQRANAEMRDWTTRRGQDLTNEDRDLGRGQRDEQFAAKYGLDLEKFGENIRQFNEKLTQTGQIAATNAAGKRDMYGDPTTQVAPEAMLPGTAPAAPSDPSVVRLRPPELAKAATEVQESGFNTKQLQDLYGQAEKLDKSNFGLEGGRTGLNWLKDRLAEGQTVLGMEGTDLQKGSQERAQFESGAGRQMAALIKGFSGAQATDAEAARLAKVYGLDAADLNKFSGGVSPFSKDRDVFLKVLKAAIDYETSKVGAKEQVLRDRGVRIGPSQGSQTPAAPSAQPNSPDQLRERYKAIRRAQPELTPEQAMEAARQGIPF